MVWLSSRWKIALLVVPTLSVFTAFVVYPVLYSLYFSFTDYDGYGSAAFNGVDNYRALFQDPFFWTSLGNTVVILVISLLVLIPGGFSLALLLSRSFRGASILRALVFAPGIIAPILVGLIWVFLLDPKNGLVNRSLAILGLQGPQWIGGGWLGPVSITLVFIWSTLGFAMTLFYAGLRLVPADVLEASSIDGATSRQQVWHITVPMMRETFAITTVLLATNVLKIFELVYQLTGGGPVHRSEVLVSYMYFITFTTQRYGQGMAFAILITVIGATVSLGYLVLLRRKGSRDV